MILTHEDGFWWFSARSVRSGDVVHRHEDATPSEGHHKPPAGLTVPPAGLRRSVAPMNHIAASAPPRQRTGLSILMGQDHRRLVLTLRQVSPRPSRLSPSATSVAASDNRPSPIRQRDQASLQSRTSFAPNLECAPWPSSLDLAAPLTGLAAGKGVADRLEVITRKVAVHRR